MTELPVLNKIFLISDVEGNRYLRLDWSNDRHHQVNVFRETADGVIEALRRAARVVEIDPYLDGRQK